MTVSAYAAATSCLQGSTLRFTLSAPAPVEIADVTDDRVVFSGTATPDWTLEIGAAWPSSLYRARFGPEIPWPQGLPGQTPCPDNEVYFVVRQAVPTAPILVSVPFTTWQAYNRSGVPGEGLYWTESPVRAARARFDRPGGGPSPERWEHGMLRWLRPAGYDVAFCSNLDLHDGLDLLTRHRMLIVNGHDEYWSAGMRDAVEEYVRLGGNVAFFSGNTAWWQIRFEDGNQTMVCHRDASADPVADPRLATVEWSATGRPENSLTGVSFRAGAGAWGEHMPRMLEESYTARFATHWVFEGTGLTDGDKFGQGCLGYETDAAEFEEIGGVPRATCRDGTPSSFVVLATADLRHWSTYGQGGMATMGVFTSGLGQVFTAATVNWGNTLHDPGVDRITRNVIDRFSAAGPAAWEVIGPGADLRAMAVFGRTLYAAGAGGGLLKRELCGQNLPWTTATAAPAGLRGLAVPREAAGGRGVALYGVSADGRLLQLDGQTWRDLGAAPEQAVGLAVADLAFYVATEGGQLWRQVFGSATWESAGTSAGAVTLGGMNGRLFAVDAYGRLLTKLPSGAWEEYGLAVPGSVLTAHAGVLVAGGRDVPIRWRPFRSAPPRPARA
ncbi:N,N-dimethylformamidase beta subunit family domain-containing protein [Nonomuraea typhae]|uniref:N,N-dimethylformamidase beta subunit family domain-containing protein n=1 Tax=Nonomuraea typhae TaxID=2603600 RepID=UPI0012F89C21|nr:N,N-dimethylformamidase beta subunit family domain-containing protein [Nonomuraea typhae]